MMINYLMIIICLLISMAFYTLLERKILSYIQNRKGPNKVGLMGIFQPFSDALKLFNKNLISLELMNLYMSYFTPAFSFLIILVMIPILIFNMFPLYDIKHNILMLFILSSMSVYSILLIGWSANSKYSSIGAIRSIAQMISYEVSFFLIILFIVMLSYSYSLTQISLSQSLMMFFWGNLILFFMWMISCLAETNRSPFDFAEGESELVSGFNVEYMGGWFALIFLAEYLNMLILSIMSSIMFFMSINLMIHINIMIIITIIFLWIRGTLPRFRYDMLMNLSWKIFLPTTLFFIPIPNMMMLYFL